MPFAALKDCPGGCGAKVAKGRCQACTRKMDQRRGSASSRGYGAAWERFRRLFVALLVAAGIAPVCGAALPDGPQTQDSQCKAAGLLVGDDLQLDHEPPLTEAERQQPRAVCDPRRVQFLCRACHARKTFDGR